MLKLYVKAQTRVEEIKKNIEGASLIEYSILIGLITAAVILTIVFVGGRISNVWATLQGTMETAKFGETAGGGGGS